MSREVAHFFWEGEISALEISAIRSFCKHGFDVYVWSYNGLEIEGTTSKDATELLPKDFLTKLNLDSVATIFPKTIKWSVHSGILRLEIINKYNGWWFDADCFCLRDQLFFKKLRKDLNFYTGEEKYHTDNPRFASGAFYAAGDAASTLLEQGHQIVSATEEYKWGKLGPDLFTRYVIENKLQYNMADVNMFYAIHHDELEYLIDPAKFTLGMRKLKSSALSHVWDAFLVNKCNLNKNDPPLGSILHYFIKNNQ